MKTYAKKILENKWRVYVTTEDLETYYKSIESLDEPSHSQIMGEFQRNREKFELTP